MMKKLFRITGIVFFISATIYLIVLVYKFWIWSKWLGRLQDTF